MTADAAVRDALRTALGDAVLAPSEENTQPWRWRLHGEVLDLRADHARRPPAADGRSLGLFLGCGAALAQLRISLAAAGWCARVRHGSDRDEDHPLARVTVSAADGPVDPRLRRWAAAIPTRRTDRRRFSGREVAPDDVELLIEAARPFGGTLHLMIGAARRAVLDAARRADRAQLARDEYAGELQRWTHRLAGARDGNPGAPAPHPRDLRTSAHAILDQYDAAQVFLLAAQADDPVSVVRAGESLGAVLLEAESLRLGVTPFTHALEVAGVRVRLQRLALGAHRLPVVALRVGRPLPHAAPIPATPRRPLEQVLVEEP
ncbi:Acg family FMN-binding oxidoreductase [Actinomycetospora chiangmaiensis]|uniref:Acg family FMN-binding oxidoreductase n=1 Tax=Actinomycetospora chiangmaiensis TaxID=402650 RepID=UPI00035EE274|nr:hypothetical protein [Actinomycetospora chiangmaiensis]